MAKKKKALSKVKTTKAKISKKTTKKTSKAVAKSPKKSAAKEMLVVASKSKEVLKNFDLNVSSDALEGLNEVVHWYLQQAARRTEANGRKTVRAHDFCI